MSHRWRRESRLRAALFAAVVASCSVQHLVDALPKEELAQSVLHADETPVQVLKPARQARAHFPARLQR
jgi:hypothetical protein